MLSSEKLTFNFLGQLEVTLVAMELCGSFVSPMVTLALCANPKDTF